MTSLPFERSDRSEVTPRKGADLRLVPPIGALATDVEIEPEVEAIGTPDQLQPIPQVSSLALAALRTEIQPMSSHNFEEAMRLGLPPFGPVGEPPKFTPDMALLFPDWLVTG